MSSGVPKFDFGDLPTAKPAKVANHNLGERNFSNVSDFSHREVTENNFLAPLVLSSQTPEPVLSCHECGHFRPPVNSPNPTQAWGHCEKRNKGRYGVAMACESLVQAELFSGREEGREAL